MNNYNYLFKFIIVGDTNVGKSCLLLQYTDSTFRQEHDATIGVEFGTRNMTLKDKIIKVQIWDTAGQESFRSITRSYYRGSIGGLLVFDVTNRSSFDNIVKWYTEIQGFACDKMELFVIGNKVDLEDRREVQAEEAQKLAQKHGFLYFETSAKTGENVDTIFEKMTSRILAKVESDEIDPSLEVYGIKVGGLSLRKQKDGQKEDPNSPNKKIKGQNNQTCC